MKNTLSIGLLLLCVIFLFGGLRVNAQENVTQNPEEESRIARLRLTLQYGIDSEIIEILPLLIDQQISEFAPDMEAILQRSNNDKLLGAALRYFRELEIFTVADAALRLLSQFETRSESLLLELLRYLKASPTVSPAILDQLQATGQSERIVVARSALDTLAIHGTLSEGPYLLEIIKDSEQPNDVRGGAILAVGAVGYPEANERLMTILADTAEPLYLRRYAATSLGQLRQSDSLPLLKEYLDDPNATIRAHVVEALGHYSEEDINDILNDALRDSHWQVRVRALDGMEGRKTDESIYRTVQYKAEYDPDRRVRARAIEFIADYGDAQSYHFLRQALNRSHLNNEQRVQIIIALIQQDYQASKQQIISIIRDQIARTRPPLLIALARELGNLDAAYVAEIYRIFLESTSREIILYALQGIGRNRLRELEPDLIEFRERTTDLEIQGRIDLLLEQWSVST